MKKSLFFISVMGILMLLFSCSDKKDEGVVPVSVSEFPLVKKAKALECVKNGDFVLPNIGCIGKKNFELKELRDANHLSLNWNNLKYDYGDEVYNILLIPITQSVPFSVSRYFKEYGKLSRTIITPLYAYLSIMENKETDSISCQVISYAPDIRYLRSKNLSFKNFFSKDPLKNGYSGLFLVSDMDGNIKNIKLYYRGTLKSAAIFVENVKKDQDENKLLSAIVYSNSILSVRYISSESITKTDPIWDNEMWEDLGFCPECNRLLAFCMCSENKDCGYCRHDPCVCEKCGHCKNYIYSCTCPCNVCYREQNWCICKKCSVCHKKETECMCQPCADVCGTEDCVCRFYAY